jgi:hypothetical protein
LGGYDAIAAVTDEFIARLAGDKQLVRWQLPAQACGISNKTRFSESLDWKIHSDKPFVYRLIYSFLFDQARCANTTG